MMAFIHPLIILLVCGEIISFSAAWKTQLQPLFIITNAATSYFLYSINNLLHMQVKRARNFSKCAKAVILDWEQHIKNVKKRVGQFSKYMCGPRIKFLRVVGYDYRK